MWDNVIIGKGNKGSTAEHVFKIPGDHHISENKVSYWIHHAMFGLGMTIFKDTPEGKHLQELIETNASLDRIQRYINLLVIKHINPQKLVKHIEFLQKEAFNQGRAEKAKELRHVLGI